MLLAPGLVDDGIDSAGEDDEHKRQDDDHLLVGDDVSDGHLLYSESISKPIPSIFISFKNFNLLIS